MSDFFKDISSEDFSSSISNEIAILQERIILPKRWTNIIGKFFIPILFPLVDNNNSAIEKIHRAPSTKNIICSGFITKSYTERNFIRLTIPKHLFLSVAIWDNNYKHWYIPNKTEFIVSFIGGSTLASNIKIIGVSL